ncbi:MAG: acyl carrier protein [Clostridia bacterium]|nr:acyl carrier protein [Clostridia bacterium]MBO7320182.1 acyl carrier protein [Clostridia bacterium]
MDTMKKIKEIISQQTGIDEEAISESTTLEDIMADSLDTIEMLMAIEDSFDIDIPDEDAKTLQSVGGLCAYIDDKLMS